MALMTEFYVDGDEMLRSAQHDKGCAQDDSDFFAPRNDSGGIDGGSALGSAP